MYPMKYFGAFGATDFNNAIFLLLTTVLAVVDIFKQLENIQAVRSKLSMQNVQIVNINLIITRGSYYHIGMDISCIL